MTDSTINANNALNSTLIRTKQGDTVDSICQRYFGYTSAITEQTFALNPHIKSTLVFESGVTLILPTVAPVQQLPIVQLWD